MTTPLIAETLTVRPCPQPGMDLMVTEEDVVNELAEDVVVVTTSGQLATKEAPKKSKILLIISDDLCYTLEIRGQTLSALIESVSADEQLKSEWHLWHRFVTNPELFYVYIFDNDFSEYVRHRESIPIRHLSKIKIKNKFYVSQSLNSNYNHFIGSQSLDCLDTEPTDALIGDQCLPTVLSAPVEPSSPVVVDNKANNSHKSSSIDLNHSSIQTSTLNVSQFHHNYHMSPSAPISTPPSVTATVTQAISSSTLPSETTIQSKAPKLLTKATKKLFVNSATDQKLINDKSNKSKLSLDDSQSSDLLADAPTGPTDDWSEEQTVTYLEMCQKFIKDLAPKKNVMEVKPNIWEQLAKELNTKGFGSFTATMCRNHFSRLRLTYTNILCYPALVSETRWPYFDLMKQIIGEKPIEMQPQVKTRAQSAKLSEECQKSAAKQQKRASGSAAVMKNSANQEVSELYVALLNLVKKYMKYFETEKKNKIWTRIEKEMNSAGYKWNAFSLRALFHRLRYHYLKILRSVGDEELATSSWPYFRYFHGLDLSAFRSRKMNDKYKKSLKAIQKAPKMAVKRKPIKRKAGRTGRPRKPVKALNKAVTQITASAVGPELKPTAREDESGNGLNCEVSFIEYSDEHSTGSSDVEGVENKKKVKSD